MDKSTLCATLRAFINQRPGLEYGNYGDPVAYRAEMRSITKDRKEALELLKFVEWHDSITADSIKAASEYAFSGRLSIVERDNKIAIAYTTGQYFPTEYRRAVCAVLSNVIWNWLSVDCGLSTGDAIRKAALREFGRGIASRWFR